MQPCIAITLEGLPCSRVGVEHPGGNRCGIHWRFFNQLINQQGLEEAIRIQRAADARNIINAHIRRDNLEVERRAVVEVEFNARAVAPMGDLHRFAEDKQNVHTTEAVNRTKEIIKKVLAVPVPSDYRWNIRTVSKTPGSIIWNCQLGINAGRIMMDKYTLDDNIYEMGNGIYGKVLDGVWQYIEKSKDKEDLCKILAQELKENVGMCLQGNLARLCNALAGYMEGIGPQESLAEILGREFAKLSEIEDLEERKAKGNKILDDNKVVGEKRDEWMNAIN